MTCQNCSHTLAAHTWKDYPERSDCGQPCDCTAYREPEPAEILLDDDDMGDATPMTGEAAIQYRPAVDRLTDQERALLYPTTDSKGLEQRVLSIITNRRLTLTNSKDESLESEPAATDLPDAETAWEEYGGDLMPEQQTDDAWRAFKAGFAAASEGGRPAGKSQGAASAGEPPAVLDALTATDLPDAEAAWITFNTRNGGMTRYADNSNERDVFAAGFAAASGPWAEHLDAPSPATEYVEQVAADNDRLEAERDAALARAEKMESFEDALALPQLLAETAAERDAALARNAELEKWQANHGDCQTRILIAESDGDEYQAQRDALRAELDNLRGDLNQLTRTAKRWTDGKGNLCGYIISVDELAAIVRGSDDEAETNTDLICKCGRNIPCRHCPEESPTQTVTKRPGKGSL